MEMGQKDAINLAGIESHFVDVARAGVAGIKHKHLLASNDQRAWAASLVVWHGRASATDCHVQAVGQVTQRIAGKTLCSHAFGNGHTEGRACQIQTGSKQA